MSQGGTEKAAPDRKLGDEWNDWNGQADPQNGLIDERPATFLFLASGILLISAAVLLLGWFLVKPRFEQLDPTIAQYSGWMLMGLTAGFFLAVIFEVILMMKLGSSLLPYKITEKFVLSLLPGTIWLGAKFGISRDRIGNSFLKLHNLITKKYIGRRRSGRLLVLLPRCLKKEARARVTENLSGDFKVYTAAGGEEARKAIKDYRPSTILAVACERDLMSGIREVADKIPVLAIPNQRPEGPCKNTEVAESHVQEMLDALTGKSIRKSESAASSPSNDNP